MRRGKASRRRGALRSVSVRISRAAYETLKTVARRMNAFGGNAGTHNTPRTVFAEFVAPLIDCGNLAELISSGIFCGSSADCQRELCRAIAGEVCA